MKPRNSPEVRWWEVYRFTESVMVNALVLTGLITLRVIGNPETIRTLVTLPLRSAEHLAVMSIFRKATRSTSRLRSNGTRHAELVGSSLVCAEALAQRLRLS